MTRQVPETTQLYLTGYSNCPYVEGNQERKLFTHLTGRRASALHSALAEHGFRRSQNIIYRPACEECTACQSSRVLCAEFLPSKRFRRTMRKNADLEISVLPPVATEEQYDLFIRYLFERHDDGGMSAMSFSDYEYMVEDTPVETQILEYRTPAPQGGERELIGVALTDVMRDGYSMVYSFFEPSMVQRSMGTFIILDHIARAQTNAHPHVYLGYWVSGSPKMDYKAAFSPLEVLGHNSIWRTIF